jgi:hypothetical protein
MLLKAISVLLFSTIVCGAFYMLIRHIESEILKREQEEKTAH